MSQLKRKITTRSASRTTPIPESPAEYRQEQATPAKPKQAPAKKPMQKSLLAMGFKKQEAQIQAEPVEHTYSIRQLLRPVGIAQIVQKCPRVKQLYQLLVCKPYVKEKLVSSCLDKYFHSNTTSLWSNKYAPKQFNELFQAEFAQKIQEWVKDFYYFRKQSNDDQFGFIDDESDELASRSLQVRMKEHGWNCRALVLKGRSGVGKSSLLKAIAQSMGIRCFEYACDVDQLQKMKQLLDGASSDAVNNIQNRKKDMKNNKLIKENSSIFKFMPQTAAKQCLQTKQPKRMQIFRNFTHYFPPTDKAQRQNPEDAFYKYLFDSIHDSSIPYVLSTSELDFNFRQKQLNDKFIKFDQIEFAENTVEALTYFYWVIFQIESNLNIENWHKIKKGELFSHLNSQLESSKFCIADNMHLFRQLVIAANKRPLCISNCLQFHVLSPLRCSRNQMVQQIVPMYEMNYYMEKAISQVGIQIAEDISSFDLVGNIDWTLYERAQQEINPLEQTATDQPQKQQHQLKKCIEEQTTASRKPSFKQLMCQLELAVVQDRKVYQNQYFYYEVTEPKQQDSFLNIPIQTHIRAKRNIVKNIKNKLAQEQARPDLNIKNLYYLPLRFAAKRSSRSLRKFSRETVAENMGRVMNFRELQYLQKFGKFIFPA